MKCSACLKEVGYEEFITHGCLCKECGEEVDRLYKKGGQKAASEFWRRKREEWGSKE